MTGNHRGVELVGISLRCCVQRSPAEGIAQRSERNPVSSLCHPLHLIPDTDVTDNKVNKICGLYVMLVGK